MTVDQLPARPTHRSDLEVPDFAATVFRKLGKSIQQRGLLSTVKRCGILPFKIARTVIRSWLPEQRRYKRAEFAFDRNFHLDTRPDMDVNWIAGIESDNWKYAYGYFPVPLHGIEQTVGRLAISPSEFTFVDFGSGKGRSLFLASMYPLVEIIGVEFSQRLHEVASGNIAAYRNTRQQCFNLRAIHCDAVQFPIPDGPAILFFNNPFEIRVFRCVMENILASYREAPRKLIVIYYNAVASDAIADVFRGTVFQERLRNGMTYMIFETP